MIEDGSGNLLTADTEAIVNTVNTVGVMGKGIALQVKRAFPDAYAAYRTACERGEVEIGRMLVHDRGVLGPARYVINFPTKRHWRSSSRLADIDAGLNDLRRVLAELSVSSVAVPALGCGNGGLDWREVRPRIEAALGDLPDVRVVVYPPAGPPAAGAMPVATPRPPMTTARALLLTAMGSYVDRARVLDPVAEGISELEVQKLAYLFQHLGAPLRLTFQPGRYGPYAEQLPHVLDAMEGHQIVGFGDRSARVMDLAPMTVTDMGRTEAEDALDAEADDLLRQLRDVIDGFETPYGMELLGTVHMAAHTAPSSDDVEIVGRRVREWTNRKARLFTPHHVAVAMDRLTTHGLATTR